MLKRLILALLPLVLVFAFTGCSDTTEPDEATFADLATLGAAYINGSAPGVVSADVVAADPSAYTILDLRSTEYYEAGHIEGAIDASNSTIVEMAATYYEGKPFLCACYTGHGAGHTVFALQMLGYEAYSLMWGHSGWNSTLASSWDGKCADQATPVTTAAPALTTTYDFPTLDDYSVDARLDVVLNGGSNFIWYADMEVAGLENYFIVNYFGEADYLGTDYGVDGGAQSPGHIDGSYQFTPKASLGMDQMLEYLPTDMPVVVYCWTGQHGSQVAAYLNFLGYDAYDMIASSNNLWHSQLLGHKWSESQYRDYPLVTD